MAKIVPEIQKQTFPKSPLTGHQMDDFVPMLAFHFLG